MTAALIQRFDDRRIMISKLHIAKKQLGLDDDMYRASLSRITGKASSKEMSKVELEAVLKDFSNKGFKAVSSGRTKSGLPTTAKITALWLSGWNLSVIRDPSPKAMETFILRQTGIAKAQWLINSADAAKVIDGLKAWLVREAHLDLKLITRPHVPAFFNWPQYRVCVAQWVALRACGAVTVGHGWTGGENEASDDMINYALAVVKKTAHDMTMRDWVSVQQALGKKLRKALEGKI